MKLLRRIRNIVTSNLNDMVARAENPEKLLKQCLSDMEDQAAKARAQVAHAVAAEKKLARLVTAATADADRAEAAAAAAVQAEGRGEGGRAAGAEPGSGSGGSENIPDASARDSVRAYLVAQRRAQELDRQWNQQLECVGALKKALGELDAKIDEAVRRRDVLVARKRVALAKRDVHSTLAGIADSNSFLDAQAFEAFDRVAEQVDTHEAEAEAAAEISVATFRGGAGRWAPPTVGEAEVDVALAQLRGTAPATGD